MMGFLNWFKENPQEDDSTGSQLDLFGNSQELAERRRVDGVTVRRNFTNTIEEKGGSKIAFGRSTEALTQEVMGCETRELYKQTGAKRGRRETLPERAQEALMTGEIVASHDLKQADIQGDQEQRDDQIVNSVRGSGKKVRRWFPW
ncbi:MAG: hypothetical protein F6K17_41680 [Okeania sp. SIO3C4]|nr:hypothetical protein [Okeania sp. SIO3C4]